MKKISLVYISLSGNTESFVTRLKDYLLSQYEGIEVQKIHIKDLVKEGQEFFEMEHPYIAFLPTYLEGGNGVDVVSLFFQSACQSVAELYGFFIIVAISHADAVIGNICLFLCKIC